MSGLAVAMAEAVQPLDVFNIMAFTAELLVAQALFAAPVPNLRDRVVSRRAACATALMLAFAVTSLAFSVVMPDLLARDLLSFGALFAASCWAVGHTLRCGARVAVQIGACGYALQHVAAALMDIVHLACGTQGAALFGTAWFVGETLRVGVFAVTYAAAYCWYIRRCDVTTIHLSSAASLVFLVGSVLLITVGLSSYVYSGVMPAPVRAVVRATSALTCVMILLVFGELSRNQRLHDEIAFVRRMGELRTDYYELLKDTIETTNIHYHDLKHQVMRLRADMARPDGGGSDAGAVLDEIVESVGVYDRIAKTGNAALDVVLTRKSLECAGKGIRFTYMADADCLDWISDRDIYSLFGNALDNAIEALERLSDGERRVMKLTAVARGAVTNIHVSNYFDHVEYDGRGGLATLKADTASHGYGVKSMRMIVGRLGGDMAVSAHDGIFDLNIVLPRPLAYAR